MSQSYADAFLLSNLIHYKLTEKNGVNFSLNTGTIKLSGKKKCTVYATTH